MSIHNANAIVSRLGPCRIALDLVAHTGLALELALLGCDLHGVPAPEAGKVPGGPTVGYVEWPREGVDEPLADAIRPFRDMDTLVLHSVGRSRDWVENTLLAEGWSRHPAGMMHREYPEWSARALPALSFYRRARAEARNSVFGMGGPNADAVIARYAMATSHIRPGDHVLVDGAQSADGAEVLAALSNASAIRWAADPGDVADHSIDVVVAIEPDMPSGWVARLDDYQRVLKFDGRLILGIRRAEQPGEPLPANWAALVQELSSRFLVEGRYIQGYTSQDPLGSLAISPIPLDMESNGKWLFAIVAANPLAGAEHRDSYRHSGFEGRTDAAVADFGAGYDNPYLYRPMVQMGERLGNEALLIGLADHVAGHARPDSADRGAALTVLGYRLLEKRTGRAVPGMVETIRAYIEATGGDVPPHVGRWRISLSFLAGRLSELIGDRASALAWYHAASEGNWQDFSPILATKAVGAAFYEARIHIAAGDHDQARQCFRRGVDIALRAAACPHDRQLGDPDRPLPFYLTELAEVIDMGSQCANALAKFDLLDRDPGLFWRHVDVRRFGLATWNKDLQLENVRLQGELRKNRAQG